MSGIIIGKNPDNLEQTLTLFQGRIPYLSNFAITPFFLKGQCYQSTEHYFQAMKAAYFGDVDAINKMEKAQSAREHKEIGRTVKGYDEKQWEKVRQMFMENGCTAKFDQNPAAKKQLLETGDSILCESSKSDRIWANGLSMWDKDALNPKKWLGYNLLGQTLMTVRDKIKLHRSD